ncbi:hypothetical protein TSUD_142860 [Trifolium subterraneum]|uniref:Uncharacterized protein n=1 Tax=Trifolium subterraneum TaxID=3900 RepID=A0A2Z6PDR4_TRISU|nr:hypothetical protein TSUD_142860 [Trifolium subterraneum]
MLFCPLVFTHSHLSFKYPPFKGSYHYTAKLGGFGLLASLIPQFPSFISAKELSDSGEPLETPHLGFRLERQIRSHYTRADGSLNDRGKGLVKYRPVVFEKCSSGMETPSKYNSVESVRCFREVIKLYDGGDDAEVIVDPVGEGEFITTVNAGEPHYFYMYGAINQTFNLWFPPTAFEIDVLRVLNVAPIQLHLNRWAFVKAFEVVCFGLGVTPTAGFFFSFYYIKSLTPRKLVSLSSQPNRGLFTLYASNFKNYQDSFLRIRCGPKLPDLMYDSERKPLFPFYWSADPRVVRGVDDSLLTPFERETVDFLDTFCLLDIKDQKRLAPDASVDPLTQVIVEDGAPKGVKRKKRTETGKGPTKIPKGNESSSAAVGEPEQQDKGGAGLFEPPKKLGYQLRSSGTGKDAGVGNSDDGVTVEKEETFTQPPPSVQNPHVVEATPTAWGSDFDPSVFLDSHLAMKGDATKFNSMGIAELRKLALGHELKGAVLNNLLSQRQERETREANERADRVAKTAEDVEQCYETAKSKLKEEVVSLKKAHEADLEKEKKDYDDACQKLAADNEKKVKALNEKVAKNCGRVDDLITSRNQNIVALCFARKQIAELEGEVEELEEDNSSLKETLADKYIDGFLFAVKTVKLVFPDLDPERLAQVDVMKKIEGGQLVPR